MVEQKSASYGYQATPLGRIGESLEKTFKEAGAIGKAFVDEGEINVRKATKVGLETIGLLFGKPLNQPRKTIDAVWGGAEQEDFDMLDVVYGRQQKDSRR